MKKPRSNIEQELKASGATDSEAKALFEMADVLRSAPNLSTAQKKKILAQAVPELVQKPWWQRHLMPLAISTVAMLILIPAVLTSQPDDGILYRIKQGADSVREIVQPGIEPEESAPVPTPENESQSTNSTHENDVDDDNAKPEDHKSEDDENSEHQQDDYSSKKDDITSSERSGASNDEPDHNSARDACRDALDVRKKNGEDIDSKDYKQCDNL